MCIKCFLVNIIKHFLLYYSENMIISKHYLSYIRDQYHVTLTLWGAQQFLVSGHKPPHIEHKPDTTFSLFSHTLSLPTLFLLITKKFLNLNTKARNIK